MKILFTGGGTLGPVTPLLAVAEELKRSMRHAPCSMMWLGTRKGPERQLVEEAGIPYRWIFAPKWRRYFDLRNLITPLALHLATKLSWFKLLKIRPDVIITAGGYVGVPVVWAAWWLRVFGVRIPCLLHNQDVRWSLANKLVAPCVKRITYALPGTVPKRWKHKAVWTGNPVRGFVLKGNKERGLKLCGFSTVCHPERSPKGEAEGSRTDVRGTVLVIGGGTGAKRLNEIVGEALPELTKHYQAVHITGRGKQPTSYLLPTTYYRSFEFVTHEIADLYAAADLVITRAGMGVMAELALLSKPMIIVPIPGSHQEDNARYFEKRGAAVALDQTTLNGAKLVNTVRGLLNDGERLRSLAAHVKELANPEAAKRVAQEVMEIAKK